MINLMNLGLVAAALLPAIILCIYVFKKDRVEKEPIGLLLKLLLFGALICFPAAFVEGALLDIIKGFFLKFAYQTSNGQLAMSDGPFYLFKFSENFIGIALVEEGFKWLVLYWVTRNNENFNSLFDGIIYAVFVSLGFAAFENVLYVLQYGWVNALMRGLLSVPGHMFFGVMMGYHYSYMNIYEIAAAEERRLKIKGIIPMNVPEYDASASKRNAILIPTLAHGFYDFCCNVPGFSTIIFFGFVIFMYVHCFRKIGKMSFADGSEGGYAVAALMQKYPHLREELRAEYYPETVEETVV